MKITYLKADAGGKSILAVHDSRETSMAWEASVITPYASARGATMDEAVSAVLALRGSGTCPDWQDKKYRGLSAGAPYPGHRPIPAPVVPAAVEAPAEAPARSKKSKTVPDAAVAADAAVEGAPPDTLAARG